MKTKLSLAVAAALLAGASSANAGIMIPAGDWTLDIGGVVNMYYTSTRHSGDAGSALTAGPNNNGSNTKSNITTGLLPNYLTVSGKTRQNDLDVGFTISVQPGAATTTSLSGGGGEEHRQQFLTFGDKSWGSIKLGKDLGIFASDAILNDMTLLGVGSGAGTLNGTTTLGRIGTGYIYADWKNQVAYSSPNWNGFSFTGGVTQGFNANGTGSNYASNGSSTEAGGASPAFEGKASYEWAGDFGGKVWVSGITQKVKNVGTAAVGPGFTADLTTGAFVPNVVTPATQKGSRGEAVDIGATVNVAGFALTGYYFTGSGIGNQYQMSSGFDSLGNQRDSDGGYVQATYTIPNVGTKIGASWGVSNLDSTGLGGDANQGNAKNEMWTLGAYHPITKHLNLVAEYSDAKDKVSAKGTGLATNSKAKTVSLGAILFF
jgi:predicted porin